MELWPWPLLSVFFKWLMFIKFDVALNENRIFQHECVWITHLLIFWWRDWGLVFIFIKCFLMWKPTSFLYYLRYQTLGAQPAHQVRSGYSSSKKQFKESKITKRFIQCCPHWEEGQRVQRIPQVCHWGPEMGPKFKLRARNMCTHKLSW